MVELELEEGSVDLHPPPDGGLGDRAVGRGGLDEVVPAAADGVEPVSRQQVAEPAAGVEVLAVARLVEEPEEGQGRRELGADGDDLAAVDEGRGPPPLAVEPAAEAVDPAVLVEHPGEGQVRELFLPGEDLRVLGCEVEVEQQRPDVSVMGMLILAEIEDAQVAVEGLDVAAGLGIVSFRALDVDRLADERQGPFVARGDIIEP